jgi:hypothetical protein
LRVSNLQETITVTGETPVVDIRSTRREAGGGSEDPPLPDLTGVGRDEGRTGACLLDPVARSLT